MSYTYHTYGRAHLQLTSVFCVNGRQAVDRTGNCACLRCSVTVRLLCVRMAVERDTAPVATVASPARPFAAAPLPTHSVYLAALLVKLAL